MKKERKKFYRKMPKTNVYMNAYKEHGLWRAICLLFKGVK